MYPLTIDFINERTAEAKALWQALYINPVTYDLSLWGAGFQSYPAKEYPTPPPPKAGNRTRQGRTARKQSEVPDTNHKSEEEPPR